MRNLEVLNDCDLSVEHWNLIKHGHIFKANLLNWITIYVNNGEFWHIL